MTRPQATPALDQFMDDATWGEGDMTLAFAALAALKGCIHHDNALLDAYRIPVSLRRQIEQAITLADAERVS